MFDPLKTYAQLTDDQLADALCEQAAHVHAATCRLLELVGAFDRRRGWNRDGCLSCAHFLSWRCGIALRTGHEHVRVARRLTELRLVHAAFARGELSYSKVRVLTRIAQPATEADLVANALDATAAQLETVGRLYRRTKALEECDDGGTRRYLRCWWDDDGALVIQARLPADDGARFVAAVDALTPEPDRPGADDIEQRRADALSALSSGPAPSTEVVVHVDAAVLAGESADGTCHVEGAVGLTAEVARRLACDGGVRLVVDGAGGDPLDDGRRSRTVPAALRRALRSRDGGCTFPGCPNQRWVDAHHVRHWATGGRTALGNLVLLCRRHHRLVHEGGYRMQRDGGGDGDSGSGNGGGGAVRILDPTGRDLSSLPTGRPVRGSPIEERHVRAALGIGPATAMARAGPIENRPDYDLWIGSIMGAERLATAPPS